MIGRLLLAAAFAAALPLGANAQSSQNDWKSVVAKAKGQTLNAVVAGEEAYQLILATFGKKFGVNIETTVSRPSVALARIRTEQKNGEFVWDVWMGGTSNMVNQGVPAGLFEPLPPMLILPEVKEVSNWRDADFIFGDSGKHVSTFSNKLEFYVLRNTKVVPEAKFETWDDLLNPKFKGKIAMRDASVPNAGTFALATAYGVKGPDYLKKLLQQDPQIYNNPKQLQQAIFNGGAAVSIGLETFQWDKCRADGGCKDVDMMWNLGAAISLGMSVPKKPPHHEAATVFVNWMLSKEGQTEWVKDWAKGNTSGAVSMRKDVAPFKGQERDLPDFDKPQNYVFVSTEMGSDVVKKTIKMFKDVTGR
jgi:iron(III) transport system substrate-binding protein